MKYLNKIICGDCLEVMKDWPDGCVDLVVTSPPYNMRTRIRDGNYTEREQCDSDFSNKYKHFGDALPIEEYRQFHSEVINELLRIAKTVFINIQIVTGSKEAWFKLIGQYAPYIKDIIIWDKGVGQPAMHRAVINRSYEIVLAFESSASAGRAFCCSYFGRGLMPDIWRLGRGSNGSTPGHAAVFPLVLAERCINGWSRINELILDPFCGSGTTCVAAKMLGRNYIGIDISPEYCEIARQRLKAVDTGVPVSEQRQGQKGLWE
jgi:site-specific DNA-methyltransferase (adenine-specific)